MGFFAGKAKAESLVNTTLRKILENNIKKFLFDITVLFAIGLILRYFCGIIEM